MSECEKVQKVIDSVLAGKPRPIILEAGCGSLSHVRFPADAHIVGIDVSQEQLDRNRNLSERIRGDIQYYEFPEHCFDAIVCWDVLEHLEKPEKALERFNMAIRAGGIIILSAPNPLSSKGIVARLTPYWFHLWFYRVIRGWKESGMYGNPPFPTYLKLSMTPGAIRNFALRNGLVVLHESVIGHGDSRDVIGRKSGPVDAVMKVINVVIRVLSLGRIRPETSQCYFILQKSRPAALASDFAGR